MPRLFISYRRADTAGYAGRLYDHLARYLKQDQLFMDIDSIAPGLDFVQVIEDAVGQCDAVLVLIGPSWETITDERGKRRLDDPNDFVRLEISTALKRNIRVIPVLVGNARMPASNLLPDDLKPLVRRNAVQIDNKRFKFDVDALVRSLMEIPSQAATRAPEPTPKLNLPIAASREKFWPKVSIPRVERQTSNTAIWLATLVGLLILGINLYENILWLLSAVIVTLILLLLRPVPILVALLGILALHVSVLYNHEFSNDTLYDSWFVIFLVLHLALGGTVAYFAARHSRERKRA